MRLSIPAALLAALTLWPSGARALELDTVILCGARMMANAAVGYSTSQDREYFRGPYLVLNVAAYASFKDKNGFIPEGENYDSIIQSVLAKAQDFTDFYDVGRKQWDPKAHSEIVACYDGLSAYNLTDGMNVLDKQEFDRAVVLAMLQAAGVGNPE